MNRTLGYAVLVICTLCASQNSHASLIVATAPLSSDAEDPPVSSTGTGFARVEFDLEAHTLNIQVTFSELVGLTTVAHIHGPTAIPGTGNAPVATYPGTFPGFPAGVTDGIYEGTWDLTDSTSYTASFLTLYGGTAAGAEAGLLATVNEGKAYVNIHTSFAPSGEIRGFLQVQPAVPEPVSIILWGLLGPISLLIGYAQRHRTTRTLSIPCTD